jgi:IS1 family transposase
MNKLPLAKRVQILSALTEGTSMRSASRLADVSINSVSKLLVDAGKFCAAFHDARVRNVKVKRVQLDETWTFTAAKAKNVSSMRKPVDGAGDTWTWVGLEAQSKLIVSHFVGSRDGYVAKLFVDDLKSRIAEDTRIQITSDGLRAYLEPIEAAFGADADYAQLQKIYGATAEAEKRYSPAECIGTQTRVIEGNPDPRHISTSYVERQNLTMRMHMRRFTRLTNAFSKKFENHAHMVAIYAVWYNWIRVHKTLRVTPAMEAKLTNRLWAWEELVAMMDAEEQPKKRGPYKKRQPEISN